MLLIGAEGLSQTHGFREQVVSAVRSEIVLNGQWGFQPATEQPPTADWGLIQVPGGWATEGVWWTQLPVVVRKGTSSLWQTDLKKRNKGWYRQSVVVPKRWRGSTVEIELERVATDAVVYVNGEKAGEVAWYAGKVDITRHVRFGAANEIRILVVATPDAGQVANLMGTAQAQVSFSEAALASRGLTGNVLLQRRPSRLYLDDVFVKTSVRQKTLEAELELAGTPPAGPLRFTGRMLDSAGRVVKSFHTDLRPDPALTRQVLRVATPWPDPLLWDLDQPHLYRLQTTLSSGGRVLDQHVQTFGFREFWIEGKYFYLNGTRINLRPTLDPPGGGVTQLHAAAMYGMRRAGFNFAELWPENFDARGEVRDWHPIMDAADSRGFLLSGVLLPFHFYIVDKGFSYQWDKPGIKEKWRQRMQYELKKQRNHPSVVMWGTSANFFGHPQDQDPLHIGQTGWIHSNDFWQRNFTAAAEAIATVKAYDPTRPVFTHHGAYVGDIHTLNFYLNLIPLQEREDWMSHYARFGKIPFMGIEFGTPLHCTFLRGRNGFGSNVQTEPLVTEFSAMYTGSRAYALETAEYRNLIRNNFLGGQRYKSWTEPVEMERMPAFQEVQRLFSTNTWRSWRTWEVPGGMVPWSRGHGWIHDTTAKISVTMPAFAPGLRGNYVPEADPKITNYLLPGGWTAMPAGKALMENNHATLAYIAGPEDNFTSKDHHFAPGQWVDKHLFFFNDTRAPLAADWEAVAEIGGVVLARHMGQLTLPVGEKRGVPFRFQLPAEARRFKEQGRILLTARLDGQVRRDTFLFRMIMPETGAGGQEVTVIDPEGRTTQMLQAAGYRPRPWRGGPANGLVVLGRNALLPAYATGFDWEAHVRNGGKVLLMGQHPDSVWAKRGFRTSQYISRYVFPLDTTHALLRGLDQTDLRNWAGHSRLTEAYPDYINRPVLEGSNGIPYYGWHWGNKGGVATGSIEKPHRTAWTPLLECEFDMAWSPLMTLPYGKGILVWNQLDLEDHQEQDVVAALLARRLVQYADTVKPLPRSTHTILIGDDQDAVLLRETGVRFSRQDRVSPQTTLLLAGTLTSAQEAAVLAYANTGGRVLVLPRRQPGRSLGVLFAADTAFGGGRSVPRWPETAGLSVGEVRYRTQCPSVLIQSGCEETGADGLLGRRRVGRGRLVFVQVDPARFRADSLTYFRYTRWRHTRVLAQIAANLGAEFDNDKAVFELAPIQYSVSLDGHWKAAMTRPLPAAAQVKDKHKDPGISPEALALMKENADESGMVAVVSGRDFEAQRAEWAELDGEIVYRKTIDVPAGMAGRTLEMVLAVIDDYDEVYINGVRVGKTGPEKEPVWSYNRTYTVPPGVVRAGRNTVAIRIFDTYGGGGLMSGSKNRELKLLQSQRHGLYHADYINDFEMGDDPFRYFRW